MFGLKRKTEDMSDLAATAAQIVKDTQFTPDAWWIEQTNFQLMFVYDEMQTGHRHNKLVEDNGLKLATAFTYDKFTVMKSELGLETYPIALMDKYATAPYAKVRGELYAIRPYQYFELDKYKTNGVSFIRERVRVNVPYKRKLWSKERLPGANKAVQVTDETQTVKAWMYVGISSYWQDHIDCGFNFKPVRAFSPKKTIEPEYYSFTLEEYDNK